jgi:hypothetical protein
LIRTGNGSSLAVLRAHGRGIAEVALADHRGKKWLQLRCQLSAVTTTDDRTAFQIGLAGDLPEMVDTLRGTIVVAALRGAAVRRATLLIFAQIADTIVVAAHQGAVRRAIVIILSEYATDTIPATVGAV